MLEREDRAFGDFASNTLSVIETKRHKFRRRVIISGASRHYHIILGDVRATSEYMTL